MKEFQSLQTDYLIKERERLFVGFSGAKVIARGKGMRSIETDPETVSILRLPQDEGDLLECGAQIRALPCRGFYEYRYGFGARETNGGVQVVDEAFETGFHTLVPVGPGVSDKNGNSQCSSSQQFIGKSSY